MVALSVECPCEIVCFTDGVKAQVYRLCRVVGHNESVCCVLLNFDYPLVGVDDGYAHPFGVEERVYRSAREFEGFPRADSVEVTQFLFELLLRVPVLSSDGVDILSEFEGVTQ